MSDDYWDGYHEGRESKAEDMEPEVHKLKQQLAEARAEVAFLQESENGMLKTIATLEGEVERLKESYISDMATLVKAHKKTWDQLTVARAFIVRLRDTVIGWREKDHPDGFDRRTAEIIAGWVREECKMKTGQQAMEESK